MRFTGLCLALATLTLCLHHHYALAVEIRLEEAEAFVNFGSPADTFIKRDPVKGGDLLIHTADARSVVIETNGQPRLQVGGNGNVGIGLPVAGVTVAAAALHVARDVTVMDGIAVSNVGAGALAHASVNIQSVNAAAFVGFTAASSSWSMGASPLGDFRLVGNTNHYAGAQVAFTVDADGQLGVGTTTPGRCNQRSLHHYTCPVFAAEHSLFPPSILFLPHQEWAFT
jgi:hypothetical protein